MTWLLYLRLGAHIYKVLKAHFPELGKVPIEDILAVVEELLTTSASHKDVRVIQEPTASPQMALGTAPRQYRLVLGGTTGRGPKGSRA
jgi:hypothetical protein